MYCLFYISDFTDDDWDETESIPDAGPAESIQVATPSDSTSRTPPPSPAGCTTPHSSGSGKLSVYLYTSTVTLC